jgi:hypothetical protein
MSLNVSLTINAPFAYSLVNPVTGTLTISGVGSSPFSFTGTAASATGTVSTGFIPAGSHTYTVDLNVSSFDPATETNNATVGNFTLNFNDNPHTGPTSATTLLARFPGDDPVGNIGVSINCLHGSSIIQLRNGSKKLDQIRDGDEVLSGNNLDEYALVEGISHCWLSFMGVDHDSIVFEPGSLGENEPSERLIIDPGHPMCTKKEYLEKGYDALRPAGTFWEELKGDKIYTKKWTDISTQSESSRRYDLILEQPYNTYVANGIVVRGKGYRDHRYKRFV